MKEVCRNAREHQSLKTGGHREWERHQKTEAKNNRRDDNPVREMGILLDGIAPAADSDRERPCCAFPTRMPAILTIASA